ncbi:MAG: fumarylacetoacetate hydrolase family protein [Chloroflexota bacterium]|nr:fumarylacetoacetate hydrolase family protein [Chloroflexota bacterium]
MTAVDTKATSDVEAIASEAFATLNTGRQISPFSSRFPGFDLDDGYRVTAAVKQMREARGEVPVGRKIGFTNRTIWDEYRVYAPMWGYVFDQTMHHLAGIDETLPLAGLAEPRIEPEIAFRLASAPAPGMDEAALLGCIDAVAHGFEIVQSIFPGWQFAPADTVAAYGLHGALVLGPWHVIDNERAAWLPSLAAFTIDLARDGTTVDHGQASNVLGGPLSALRHFVDLLAHDPVNPRLAAGEIVTTGTLTRAFPVAPGETWTTAISGIALEGISVTFV